MDSYEDFCARILCELQSEMVREKSCSTAPDRRVAHSLICFHGRPLLSPVLSEKQRREMVEYRKRAKQVEAEKQVHYNKKLLNQIQTILWTDKAPKILDVPKLSEQCLSPSTKTDYRNGFTVLDTANLTPTGATEPYIFSSKQPVSPSAELPAVMRETSAEEKQMQEEIETEGVCLRNLLKKSREFIQKEQGKQGSKVISNKMVDPSRILSESPSDKEHGSSLDGTASGLPFYISSPNQTSPSNLTSPEPGASLSARPHRGRPRPISTGSIFFSFPENPNQLNITAHAMPQEVKTIATQERKLLGVENVSMGGYDDYSGLNETVGRLETSPVDPELTSPLFRRRCHTLDSHLSSRHQSPVIDRSQERMPRFMAGVTARTPTRLSPPSPMNKTFTRDSPVAAFMGSGITLDSPSCTKLPFETERNSVISTALKERRTDEMQWQVHALEDMQRSLEDDYVFRMSCLMAEQEREQLHLSQESEERARRLRGQGGLSPVAGEDGCELRAGERYPILSPMCSLSPGDRSPRHPVPTIGFPSTSLDVASPSIQTPIYMRGLNHSTAKRNRLSQVVTAEQQRALCHLTAIVKGFLIRRLLKTEKVKHLRQTIQDTQEFIRSFSTDAPQRNDSLSEQDLSLQERVRAQLRAALFDVHDIFFTMTPQERLSLLQQDRELRTERKLREMEKAKSPKDKVILSAATQKSLDRKKRVGESPGQTRRAPKTKSPPTKRILQPSQGQSAPVSGQQLLRRGSYKKTPEERVQHSERLKKQHSLG
ncbi:centriolar coiled-coil protein of 110 kDa-like isoform X1 [Sinocyclocheilus anshuiensis]|uniref:centriolar coiled-coil protein of 110 kDa-like isoform X1 n=2 Tax=Sinocyclocheilus anshuiensis TaxID=1608454 RepID=UPI0007B8681E|nr:PREDICTED: centriolar coiled-coil protein of 110 kDa-like isoform X1 [Sinocyclocheilus anshuiensis]